MPLHFARADGEHHGALRPRVTCYCVRKESALFALLATYFICTSALDVRLLGHSAFARFDKSCYVGLPFGEPLRYHGVN